MRYSDIEPIPAVPNYFDTLPAVFISYGVGLIGSWLTLWLTQSPWCFAFYAPLIVLLPRAVITNVRRSRKFRRDLAAWDQRMTAHYDSLASQRRKGIWS